MPGEEITCPRASADLPWKHYYHQNREAVGAMCSEALRMMAENGEAAADAWLAGEVSKYE